MRTHLAHGADAWRGEELHPSGKRNFQKVQSSMLVWPSGRNALFCSWGWAFILLLAVSSSGLMVDAATSDSSPPLTASCLKFLALGDWGTSKVESTAKSMARYVGTEGRELLGCNATVSSVLLLGDNFYDNGITSTDDPLVHEYFEKNFATPAFENTSFSVIVGNHDHRGSVRSQVELTDTDATHRWYLPRPFYSQTFEVNKLRVLFVFIDTWDLVGGEAEVNGKDQRIKDEQQMRWIKDVLRTEDVDFKVVVGHYPIRSARRGTPGLIKDLLPVLLENNVDAYVFGHDHIAQHIQTVERNGQVMNYLGSGFGGRTYDGPLDPPIQYALTGSLGYMSFVFDEAGLTVRVHRVVDQGGNDEITYTTLIPRRLKAEFDQPESASSSLSKKIRSSLLG